MHVAQMPQRGWTPAPRVGRQRRPAPRCHLCPAQRRQGPRRGEAPGTELENDHPDAAASLREGLDDIFTVRRLGITGTLAKTLTNTNCIESMISVARRTTGRVTRWKDGNMKKRWVAAGMLEAERSFRRVR